MQACMEEDMTCVDDYVLQIKIILAQNTTHAKKCLLICMKHVYSNDIHSKTKAYK